MIPVETSTQVFDALQKAKAGATAFCTNFFPGQSKLNAWIARKELWAETREGAAFFMRKDRDFLRLYFSAGSPQILRTSLPGLEALRSGSVVTDVVGAEEAVQSLAAILGEASFQPYSRLIRLTRMAQPVALAAAASGSSVVFATGSSAASILDLLEAAFDQYADQLPSLEEIQTAIENRQILIVQREGETASLVYFETQGVTSTVRFWAVADAHRSRGYGSAVMREYFSAHPQVRRFTLWVAAANENAVQKYRHYGYQPDGLIDCILTHSFTRK